MLPRGRGRCCHVDSGPMSSRHAPMVSPTLAETSASKFHGASLSSAWDYKPFKTAILINGRTNFMVKPIRFHLKVKKFMMMSARCVKAEAGMGSKDELNLEDLKKSLVRSVANTNRGKNTTSQQRKQILKMINDLEDLNPTKDPVKSPFLSGYWSLLYTAPLDEATVDKYAGTEEGPFLARVKPLSFGSVRQTRSSQVIDVDNGIAKNIADFSFLGKNGTLTIQGTVIPSETAGKETIRVDVTFDEFWVNFGGWKSPIISLGWINPQGWIDTTFLDKDLRIGRGDKGSVFVSVRAKSVDS